MTTLILHAPRWRANVGDAKTFARTLRDGVGKGYILSQSQLAECQPGSAVWLLSKDDKTRAVGTLDRLKLVAPAGNGMRRYDVYMSHLEIAPFRQSDAKIPLSRWGVAVRKR